LTPCCGLEVQNPTQALKSDKGPDNTFDLNPKWGKNCVIVGNLSWDIHRAPHKKKKSKLIFDTLCGHEVHNPTQALKSSKEPGNIFELNLKWARTFPSVGNCS
jgi:hypothetical protein